MRMYYIGIVGALTPVAQRVIPLIMGDSALYKILFIADGDFAETDVQKAQFKCFKDAAMHNLIPDLILDFGPAEDAFKRAGYYRMKGIPAIMQACFTANELKQLETCYCKTDKIEMYRSLIIMPDYSIVKMQLMNNLRAQIRNFDNDVYRVYIELSHNANKESVRQQWMWWAQQLNCLLEDDSNYLLDNNSSTFEQFMLGSVQVTSHQNPSLDPNEEMLRISLALAHDRGLLKWEYSCSLLESRAEGVLNMLHWYFDGQNNCQELLLGEVIIADFVLDN